ncbi:DUF6531 domain-containing protein [Kribbella sp. NBC_00889]|uniref:DUF6531 domain-containing protein n=1 Tax=Kribbella sp. NBC_00889 TaxID=2975974 RepID=UPI00386D6626|nr:hypothetical protein OG817_13225 [Kribbella sp. NBC_00889]
MTGLEGREPALAAPAADPKPAAPRVASRPDLVSAVVSARSQGSKVEVESLRTETDTTWVNADGTMSTEANAAPIRFKDASGVWQPIDLDLVKGADGMVAPRGHAYGLQLGKRSGATGGVFASALAGSGRQVEWLAPWMLPEPSIEGTKATYADVQPGVDLVLSARRSGFESDFVVKQRPADGVAPVWRIPLRTKGLTAKPQGDGSIDFVDAQNVVRSRIPVAYMWDAVIDPDSGEPANRAKVSVTVEQVTQGQATLVITPDPTWFLAPDRAFPVTVDPTYAVQTAYNTFDTWVQSDYTTDQSASPELKLGTYNGGSVKARSFVHFATAPFKNKQIRSAVLQLWETYSASCTPTTFEVHSSDLASTASRWSAQPSYSSTVSGSVQVAKGYSSACPGAKVTVPLASALYTGWQASPASTVAVALVAANENDSGSWKRFHSNEGSYPPNVLITYNRAPSQTTAPKVWSAVSYAAPGGSTLSYTSDLTPWVSSTASDADGNQVRYFFYFHTSTDGSAGSQVASCGSQAVASATEAGCAPGTLPDNTQLYVRSRAGDMDTGGNVMLFGNYSSWTPIRTAAGTPVAPTVSCPAPYTNGTWTDTDPTQNVVCTVSATTSGSSYSVPGYFRLTLDAKPYGGGTGGTVAGQVKVMPPFTGGTTSTTVTIPASSRGAHQITARSESPTGKLSSTTSYGFGWGSAKLSAPAPNPRTTTTDTVRIAATAPPAQTGGAPTATVKWRRAGSGSSELVGWTDGPALSVTPNGTLGYKVDQLWDTNTAVTDTAGTTATSDDVQLNNRIPNLIDIQVCFTYSTATQCTWTETKSSVLRVPHAFGNGYPTSDAGPGQVALWTGEFNTDSTDITVPGYTGDLSISRSHATYAGPANTVNGVFGPGWVAQFDGADAGAAGLEVVDNTRIDGTIALVDGDGTALVYESPTGRRTSAAFTTGTWAPADEDTSLDASKLTITGTGTSTTLSYTEDDGTITTWTPAAAPVATADTLFNPAGIAEPGIAGKTTYSYDAAGRVSRILAPAPPSVTCPATGALNPGCRALRFDYGTTGAAAGRLVNAWLDIYNPDKTGGAGMDSINVATYTYDTSGRLATVTDPRSGLSTQYTYNAANHLTTIKPPGQVPYQLNYLPNGDTEKLDSVTRDRPTGDPAGGTATLAKYVYGNVPLSGTGLPDLSSTSVARWNQRATPTHGFAVFGPDHPLSGAPTADDWQYADLQYTDDNGYTVNTAKYGAGNWQYTSTDYDAQGNVVRELDERALRAVIDDTMPSGATVDQLASVTVYNVDITNAGAVVTPAGTLVTDTYGPARYAALKDGTVAWIRPHTHTGFDQGAPNNGINPDTSLPYRLATTETSYAQDPGTGADLEITGQTLTDYAAPVTGDADGWALSLPGKTITDVDVNGTNSTGDIVKLTRYDTEGRAIETRQPGSNGADAGTTRTVYYTAAANGECGDKPQWAGLVCKTDPAAAPTGATGTLPSTTTSAFTYLLAPKTVTETSGSVTRTSTTTYLLDGRTASTKTTVTGLAGSTPNTEKVTTYDSTSGQPTVITAKNADGSTAGTITTGYDTWGRQTSYQPSGETATTTVYDAAGRTKTITDANGSTTYTYDGIDAAGKPERRGLTTKVDVTTAGSTWTSTGAYDSDGSMTVEKLPGGVTQYNDIDNAGEPSGLRYTGQVTTVNDDGSTTVDPNGGWLSWSIDNDTSGRVAHEWTPDGAAFTGDAGSAPGDAIPYDRAYSYDNAGRLTQVKDRTAATTGTDITDPNAAPCVTRTYGFDRNDNRLTKATATSGTDGACTSTGGTTVTRAFDTADRPVTGADGAGTYSYDALGRTTTLPASDAPKPADGNVTLAYYDNDLARVITQGTTSTAFTLDALDRRSTETVTTPAGSTQTVRHYTDTSDNPTWVSQDATIQRYAELIGGDLALTVDQTGAADLTLANNHGDIVTTVDLPTGSTSATTIAGWNSCDEYGNPTAVTANTGTISYGWVGAKQRASTGAGLTLMGVRLYNAAAALFTSADPVKGGNASAYTYPSDPINSFDLDGKRRCWTKWGCRGWKAAKFGYKWARNNYRHSTFSAGGCAVLCYGVSFQGGTFGITNFNRSRQYGWSTPGISWGWANKRARDRQKASIGGGGGAGWGGYGSVGVRRRKAVWSDWEVGLSYRPGGVWGGKQVYSSWTPSFRKFGRRWSLEW